MKNLLLLLLIPALSFSICDVELLKKISNPKFDPAYVRSQALDQLMEHATLEEKVDVMSGIIKNIKEEKDPAFLMNLYRKLKPLALDGKYARQVNLMQLDLREQMRVALPGRTLQDYGYSKEPLFQPKEAALLREILTGPSKETSAPLSVKGSDIPLTVTSQPEYERRVNLPENVASLTSPYKWSYPSTNKVQTAGDLTSLMLDYFHGATAILQSATGNRPLLSLNPLGSNEEHFHSNNLIKNESTGDKPSQFVTELDGKLTFRSPVDWDRNDKTHFKYNVSHQREVGTYWDTPNQDLKKAGYALRIKDWYPIDDNGNINGATSGKSLFVKKTNGPEGPFTSRDEYQVKLPKDFPEDQIVPAMQALLKHAGMTNAETLPVKPVVEVNNERYGLNLVMYGDVKVGFLTVDYYTKKSLDPNFVSADEDKQTRQWETELLPEFKPLYDAHKSEFDAFFKEVEDKLQGKVNPTPKYLQ